MEINVKEISEGKMNGAVVWVCDLRPSLGFASKPIRHVRPTKVLICDSDQIKKRIYYSKSSFLEFNRNGKPKKSKPISLYDSTGDRLYPGIPLRVFDNEGECRLAYNVMFKEFCVEKEQEIDVLKKQIDIFKETGVWRYNGCF